MIEPKIIKRSNRKSLAITINDKGELIVNAPHNLPLYEIMSFLEKKQKWIEEKSENINKILNENSKIVNYDEIFYLGKRYKVSQTLGIDETYLTDNSILIKPCKTAKQKAIILKNWYLSRVEDIIIERVKYLSKFMKQSYKSINITNSKIKWGMCDNKRNLYFNWKLLMLSPDLIDYVIIHEIAHLIELNHSSKFWEIVKAVIPKYKHHKEVINRCGFLIKLF